MSSLMMNLGLIDSVLPSKNKNADAIAQLEQDFVKLYAKKIVVIEEDKRELINEVFNLVISGKTLRDVAIIFNDRGLRTVCITDL